MQLNKRTKIIIKKAMKERKIDLFEEIFNQMNLNMCNDIYNENNTTCIRCKYKEDCKNGF